MTTAWQKWKTKQGDVTIFDILKGERASDDVASRRLNICSDCDRFIHLTKQCKECGCLMSMKTRLAEAKCPLGKW
jgi:hypothetical protein